jgi:VanZ family protein
MPAPLILAWKPIRERPDRAWAVLALLLLGYSELTPFAFAASPSAMARQVGRVEWIPLLSYSRADAQSALFDLWRKLLLSGFWGFSFSWAMRAPPWRAAGAGLVVGGALEAAQLFTTGRTASVGDVLIFALGG